MAPGLAVPPHLEADIRAFLAEAGIGLSIVPDTQAVVSVLPAAQGPRRDATPVTLPCGGTIRCAVALVMAPCLGIAPQDLGRLLNHLGIKVRDCSLGCFP